MISYHHITKSQRSSVQLRACWANVDLHRLYLTVLANQAVGRDCAGSSSRTKKCNSRVPAPCCPARWGILPPIPKQKSVQRQHNLASSIHECTRMQTPGVTQPPPQSAPPPLLKTTWRPHQRVSLQMAEHLLVPLPPTWHLPVRQPWPLAAASRHHACGAAASSSQPQRLQRAPCQKASLAPPSAPKQWTAFPSPPMLSMVAER